MGWSDLASLAQDATTSVLGQTVTYTPSGGAAESVTAIFDDAFQVVDVAGDVEVLATQPMAAFDISDLTQTPAAGDAVAVSGVTYYIEAVNLDGSGGCECLLNR